MTFCMFLVGLYWTLHCFYSLIHRYYSLIIMWKVPSNILKRRAASMTAQAVSSTTSPSLQHQIVMSSTTAQHTSHRLIRYKSTTAAVVNNNGIVDPAVPSQPSSSKTMYNKNMPEDGMLNQVRIFYLCYAISSLQFRYLMSNPYYFIHFKDS